MELTSSSLEEGAPIPPEYALGVPDPDERAVFGPNVNPALSWSDIPSGTRSLVLVVWDETVPTKPDDVNQPDREVPADLPRTDFFHWVLVDIEPSRSGIEEGQFSSGVTERGKTAEARFGRQGLNDYTGWFAGGDLEGQYFGYDGPWPPFNDSLVHQYHFALYATDLEKCPVEGAFTGQEVRAAIAGHVLAEASINGTYTLNPLLV